MTSYEEWSRLLHELQRPVRAGERNVAWDPDSEQVGVALSGAGQVEVFLRSSGLPFTDPAVRSRLEEREWEDASGLGQFFATRVELPRGPEFLPAAAWICAELLQNGAASDLRHAVRRTEPVIAFVLGGLSAREQDVAGLLGEVAVLRYLVEEAPVNRRLNILDGWRGYERALRDLTVGSVGIEVKSTTRAVSRHHFQGVHQIEPQDGEAGLRLISVGLTYELEDGAHATTLEDELRRLGAMVAEAEGDPEGVVAELRARVDRYGIAASTNLLPDEVQRRMIRERRFAVEWVRAYDPRDAGLRLPSRRALERLSPLLAVESVAFDLVLPAEASQGDFLVAGGTAAARSCLQQAGWIDF